jgi:hypothetical protein
MKGYKINFLLFLLLFSISGYKSASAQNQIDAQANLKLKALYFLDYYAAINIIEDNDGLRSCFESAAVRMPNLILQENKLKDSLTLEQYIVRYNNFVYTKGNAPTSIVVVPYQLNIDTLNSQEMNITVDAQLYLSAVNTDKIKINDTIDVTFKLAYTVKTKAFKIKAINQYIPRGKYLIVKAIRKRSILDGFKSAQDTTVQKLPLYNLNVNGINTQTDSNGLIYLYNILLNKPQKININTANYLDFGGINFNQNRLRRIYANTKSNSTHAVYFRKSTFFLEGNFGINYFIASNPIKTTNTVLENSNLRMSNKGIGLGIYLFNKPKWEAAVVLGYSSYAAENVSYLKSYSEVFNAIDPDGSNYIRFNEITDINEFQHLNFTTTNATLQLAYKFNSKTKLNIGFRLAKKANGTLQRETEATGVYSGLYTDFFNVKISENGIYDFGTYQLIDSSALQLNSQLNFYGLQIGVERSVTKKISANVGLAFLQSTAEILTPQDKSLSIKYDQIESVLLINKLQHFIAISTFQLTLRYKL